MPYMGNQPPKWHASDARQLPYHSNKVVMHSIVVVCMRSLRRGSLPDGVGI